MKRLLLLLMALVATTVLGVQAATKYEINLGGVEITNENYSSITGGDIRFYDVNGNLMTSPVYSGSYEASAKYNPSTKTLTLRNVYIHRDGSGDYALHNRDCEGLTVQFVGDCVMRSNKARAIRFNKGGTLAASSGATVDVTGRDDGAIYFRDFAVLDIKGPGTFNIKSTSKGAAIQGHWTGSMTDLGTTEHLKFSDGVKATVTSPESPLYDLWRVSFLGNSKVTFTATNNSSYPVVRNVGLFKYENNNTVLAPVGAYFSESSKSVLTSSGSKVYGQDVVVHNDYVAILNSTNFPDANFRAWMLRAYPKGYITQSDVDSRNTIYCNGNSISNLKGIEYFNKLVYLYCYDNNLTLLPSTLPSTLNTLECYNNKLIYLPTLPANLMYLRAANNAFTNILISGGGKLLTLNLDNNKSMTKLDCSKTGVTNISISGCTALTSLICYKNDIATLPTLPSTLQSLDCSDNRITSLPSLPSTLTYLDCDNNQITSLPTLPSGIETIYAQNNKFTSVNTLDCTKLKALDLRYNTSLTSVGVSRNYALTSLYLSGCPALTSLSMQSLSSFNFAGFSVPSSVTYWDCGFNNLTSLPALPGGLKTLYCFHNALTSLPTLPSGLERLECNDNQFTSLVVQNLKSLTTLRAEDNPKLTTLNCSGNALTSLNVSNNTALTTLNCSSNKLTSLNLQGLTALQRIECQNNSLTSLNVSALSNLTYLHCGYNNLSSLNVSTNNRLSSLFCNGNQLTSLNVQGCQSLATVYCGANKLTSLSFQGCNALNTINMVQNQIKDTEMTSMVNSLRTLPSGSQGTLQVLDPTSSSEGNVFSDANVRAARAKNWIPYKWQGGVFVEITAGSVRSDLNGDGTVDVDDMNTIINIMVKKGATLAQYPAADLDGSGVVDIDDLNIIINIMVKKG